MLHFIALLEILLAIVLFSLGLALGLDPSGFGWFVAIILLLTAGVWSIVAVILTHFIFGGFTRPILMVGFIHIITFAFDLAVFIVALTFSPYTDCNATDSDSKGCEMLKAAIGIDGALWIFFLISGFVLCYDSRIWVDRAYAAPGTRRGRYYY